jgi:hypothetical protein
LLEGAVHALVRAVLLRARGSDPLVRDAQSHPPHVHLAQAVDRVGTTPDAVREWFAGYRRARVVLEVGTHSPWLSRLLNKQGHEVIVANPRRGPQGGAPR